MTLDTKILLFCKKTLFCEYAINILTSHFNKDYLWIEQGHNGQKITSDLERVRPEYIISFVSPWIINEGLLSTAKKGAINFHPGSPNYPGTGCYNFAIYEGSSKYGVTCHYMKPKVDTGEIIMTSYFDIADNETVESLKLKSMIHLLNCFNEIVSLIAKGQALPLSEEKWLRPAFTRQELNQLCLIDCKTQSEDEVRRRINSVNYPSKDTNWGAYTIIGNKKFYCETDKRDPIA